MQRVDSPIVDTVWGQDVVHAMHLEKIIRLNWYISRLSGTATRPHAQTGKTEVLGRRMRCYLAYLPNISVSVPRIR